MDHAFGDGTIDDGEGLSQNGLGVAAVAGSNDFSQRLNLGSKPAHIPAVHRRAARRLSHPLPC